MNPKTVLHLLPEFTTQAAATAAAVAALSAVNVTEIPDATGFQSGGTCCGYLSHMDSSCCLYSGHLGSTAWCLTSPLRSRDTVFLPIAVSLLHAVISSGIWSMSISNYLPIYPSNPLPIQLSIYQSIISGKTYRLIVFFVIWNSAWSLTLVLHFRFLLWVAFRLNCGSFIILLLLEAKLHVNILYVVNSHVFVLFVSTLRQHNWSKYNLANVLPMLVLELS